MGELSGTFYTFKLWVIFRKWLLNAPTALTGRTSLLPHHKWEILYWVYIKILGLYKVILIIDQISLMELYICIRIMFKCLACTVNSITQILIFLTVYRKIKHFITYDFCNKNTNIIILVNTMWKSRSQGIIF